MVRRGASALAIGSVCVCVEDRNSYEREKGHKMADNISAKMVYDHSA